MNKINPRPEGDSPKGFNIPNAGNKTGVSDSYGGGLDKGYQGGTSITGATKSDEASRTKGKPNERC